MNYAVNGFAFGYNGTTFGILRINNSTQTFTAQSNWNIDKADGSGIIDAIDFTKINVFKIAFQYLGGGTITFFIESPSTGIFERIHKIAYPNTSTVPSIGNPNLPLTMYVSNGTTTSNMTLRSASMCGMIQGKNLQTALLSNTFTRTGVNVTTSNTYMFSLRNNTTNGSVTNFIETFLKRLTFGSDGNAGAMVVISLYSNMSLTNASFQAITNSIVSTDIAATAFTGGSLIFQTLANRNNQPIFEDLSAFNIIISPGDTVTLTAFVTANTATGIGVLNWVEDF